MMSIGYSYFKNPNKTEGLAMLRRLLVENMWFILMLTPVLIINASNWGGQINFPWNYLMLTLTGFCFFLGYVGGEGGMSLTSRGTGSKDFWE